jgi:hypothetical protein
MAKPNQQRAWADHIRALVNKIPGVAVEWSYSQKEHAALIALADDLSDGICYGIPHSCPCCSSDNIGYEDAIVVRGGREIRSMERPRWTCFDCGSEGRLGTTSDDDDRDWTMSKAPELFGDFERDRGKEPAGRTEC